CGMVYQEDSVTWEIENQLLLIDTKKLPSSVSYDALMKTERILKRNYFDFSS
ncbi:YokU family protein, partial [Bacillus licheniformis]